MLVCGLQLHPVGVTGCDSSFDNFGDLGTCLFEPRLIARILLLVTPEATATTRTAIMAAFVGKMNPPPNGINPDVIVSRERATMTGGESTSAGITTEATAGLKISSLFGS
jgi:hypothetical protein